MLAAQIVSDLHDESLAGRTLFRNESNPDTHIVICTGVVREGRTLATTGRRRPRLGLALSGGALKASAHIGILNALNRLQIYPDCVAGTSAGAFIAAAYAHGFREPDFDRLRKQFPARKLLDYGFPVTSALWNLLRTRWKPHAVMPALPNGLLRGRRLHRYLASVLRGGCSPSSALPFYVIATDLWTGSPVSFSNDAEAVSAGIAQPAGDLAEIIQASCSLPGIFTPVTRDPWLLADGACRHYVPVRVLHDVGCEKVIAVNLYNLDEDWSPESFVHVLSRSYNILLQDAVENDVAEPNVFVLTPEIGQLTWLSFEEIETGVQAGERVVAQQQQRIEAFLRAPNQTAPVKPQPPTVRLAARRD